MAERKVAIRFGTEGKAQVVADLDAIGKSGDASAKRWGTAFTRAGRDVEEALERQQRAAEKLAAFMPGLNPAKLDMYAGVQEGTRKSAEASAAVFGAAFDKMEQKAQALRAAIDPAYAAQLRFDNEIAHARDLLSAGAISLDDYSKRAWQLHQGMQTVEGTTRKTNTAFAAAAPQIQDFFTQITMGANPLQVLSVQGGQLAGQLQYAEGAAGKFARYLMSGWGIGIQVGLMVLGPLVSKLWEGSDASEALKRKVDGLADALSREKFGTEEATKALQDYNDTKSKAVQQDSLAIDLSIRSAEARLKEALAIREQIKAQIDKASADEGASRGLGGGALIAVINAGNDALDAQQGKIDLLNTTLANLYVDRSANAEKLVDPIKRINDQYDRQRDAAIRAAQGNVALSKALAGTRQEIERNRQAALKAEQERQSAARSAKSVTQQFGREVSSSQAASIARAAGLQVNSSDRTYASQKRLYDAWVAAGKPKDNPVAKPGTSAHEHGNALDIQMSAGVTVKKIKDAFAAEGVRLTKVFAERGHWHVEWSKTGAQKEADRDLAKAERDAEAKKRELDGDLAEIIKGFNPARAQAEALAATLAKIDKLVAGGRLGEQDIVNWIAKRNITEGKEAFKDIAKDVDPIYVAGGQEIGEDQKAIDDKAKDRIQSLADFYHQAFSGGVSGIWDMFRQQGLKVLSELLAKWTIGKNGGNAIDSLLGLVGLGSKKEPGKNAAGTEYWSGGATWLAENGPEIVNLPRGSRVTPAAETRRLLGSNDNAAPRVTHNYFNGNLMTPEFWAQIQAGDDGAAMRGAAGGSQMAVAEVGMQSARRLGRRW